MALKFRNLCAWILMAILVASCFECKGLKPDTAYTDDLESAAVALPADLAKYRRMGLPWTAEDVPRPIDLRDEDNAATYLISAEEKLRSILPDPKSVPQPGKSSLKAADPKVWKFQNVKFDSVLTFGKIAAEQKALDYHHDWDQGAAMMLPEFSDNHNIVFLMCYEAERAAAQKNVAATIDYLTAAQKLIRLVGSEPLFLANSVMARDTEQLCSSYEVCLEQFYPDDVRFSELINRFELKENRNSLQDQLKSEMYMQVVMVRQSDESPSTLRSPGSQGSGPPQTQSTPPTPNGIPVSIRQRAYLDRVLRFWMETYPSNKDETLLQAANRFDADLKKTNNEKGDSYACLQIISFDQTMTALSVEQANSRVRAENLLVAALRYRKLNRTWPPSLSGFGPITDSILRKPFLLKIQPAAITIYSVADITFDQLHAPPPKNILATGPTAQKLPPTPVIVASFPVPKKRKPMIPFE